MKISSDQIQRVLETGLNETDKIGTGKTSMGMKPDQATFSDRAREIDLALSVLAKQPEVRQDKVDALRRQIADGTFKVSAETIADNLLSEARLTQLLKK
jgi:negative regulator of flagellin synthesis FlgM